MIKTLLTVSTLLLLVTNLHLPQSQTNYQHQTFLHTDIHLSHLQDPSNKTDPKLIQTHLDLITNQITLLEKTYQQIDNLNQVEAISNDGTLIKCKDVSEEDQIYFKHTVQNADTDLWAVYFEIQQYTKEGGASDELGRQYQQLKQRKQVLEQSKNSYCPTKKSLETQTLAQQTNSFTDISINAFTSNLNTNGSWSYGKISQQQYEINQFQFLLNNDVVQCPVDTPFASKGKCVSCDSSQVFFLDTAQCGTCPNGTDFNSNTHQCQEKVDKKCPGNQVYNSKTKKCECPSGLPYFDGTTCLGCFIPQYWNPKTLKCESCQKGSYYSLSNETCLTCPIESDFISSLSGCNDVCTLSKPYFNGQMCISCPQLFNSNTKQCEECEAGLEFSTEKRTCVQKGAQSFKRVECDQGYTFNSQNGQCIKQSECSCPSNYEYNKATSKCECPTTLPYDTGVNCISCKSPNTWNKESRKCEEPQVFDPVPIDNVTITTVVNTTTSTTVNTTTTATTNQTSSSSLSSATFATPTCGTGEIWNSASKTCICSSSTPYRTLSGVCIACNAPSKWSTALNKCLGPQVSCNSNFVYDPTSQSCICPRNLPFSDGKTCQSCYLPMYWNNLDRICKYCPQNQYFNPMNRKCELCPESRPLLVNHVCQSCNQGSKYNPISFRCQSLNCVGGSVYKVEINDCYCPDSRKPFYNGRECVSCKSPNRWDLTSRSCVFGSPTLWTTTPTSK